MTSSEESERVWYHANCHCANIRYKVQLPPLETLEIMNCNCSICSKNGYMNVYPNRRDIVFVSGEDTMKGYQFGNEKSTHQFCPMCGSSLFIDPYIPDNDKVVVNVSLSYSFSIDGSTGLMLVRYA